MPDNHKNVTCEICGTMQFSITPSTSWTHFRNSLISQGWTNRAVRNGVNGWVCPGCGKAKAK